MIPFELIEAQSLREAVNDENPGFVLLPRTGRGR